MIPERATVIITEKVDPRYGQRGIVIMATEFEGDMLYGVRFADGEEQAYEADEVAQVED